jgi:uncharacterized membrane protein YagU involved in acid resistance
LARDGAMLRAVIGFVSGIVATGPMTAAMIAWHRKLPSRERYPLPPGEIVAKLAKETVAETLPADAGSAVTMVAHYGYGGAAGAAYALIDPRVAGGPIVKGAVFGLVVWLVSYLGLLPGSGILEPATRHPTRRNALMIAAHGVWGVALAAHHAMLDDQAHRLRPASGPDVNKERSRH